GVTPWPVCVLCHGEGAFLRGAPYDGGENMGGPPPLGTYLRVLGITTLPWLPLAAIGGWRTWRAGEGGLAVRLLTVWTAVGYGALLIAAKHSPRYLMLLHPAVALWAAFALAPWLGGRLVPVIGALAGLAWL